MTDIVRQADRKCQIGLWNWYLPALTQLLLTDGTNIHEVAFQTRDRVQQLTDFIMQNTDYLRLFDEPHTATQYLMDKKVWIVFGAGGAFLPPKETKKDEVRAIFPKEGGVLFVECAAAIRNPYGSEALSRGHIEHLLKAGYSTATREPAGIPHQPSDERSAGEHQPTRISTIEPAQSLSRPVDFSLSSNIVLRRLPTFWREMGKLLGNDG